MMLHTNNNVTTARLRPKVCLFRFAIDEALACVGVGDNKLCEEDTNRLRPLDWPHIAGMTGKLIASQ